MRGELDLNTTNPKNTFTFHDNIEWTAACYPALLSFRQNRKGQVSLKLQFFKH